MFNGLIAPKKPTKKPPPLRIPNENFVPILGVRANEVGHCGPWPNSQYRHRYMLYKQREDEYMERYKNSETARLMQEKITCKYDKRYENNQFRRKVNERLSDKLRNHEIFGDAALANRRTQLSDLIAREERQYIHEVVDKAQRARENEQEEIKNRIEEIQGRFEDKRLKVVEEKRLLQYLDKLEELRPVVRHRRLIESKKAQRIQIEENKLKREAEKQQDHFWYQIFINELNKRIERDEQDKRRIRKLMHENKTIWDTQCKVMEYNRQEEIRKKLDDGRKLDELHEQIRREEMEELNRKRNRRNELYRDYMKQIKAKEEMLDKKMKDEEMIKNKFNELQKEMEIKEKKISDKEEMRRDIMMYFDYIAQLDEERREQENRLDVLVAEELKVIQKKQDKAFCKMQKAKDELKKAVMEGRKEQLEYKKQEVEEMLKMKQAEIEMCKLAMEHNNRMQAEYQRQRFLNEKKYRDDLKKQAEYSQIIKKREMEEIERHLVHCKEEENEYKQKLFDIFLTDQKFTETHPFQKVFEGNCQCPSKT